jgi:hypothetical protein
VPDTCLEFPGFASLILDSIRQAKADNRNGASCPADTVPPKANEEVPQKKKGKQNKNDPHFHLADELRVNQPLGTAVCFLEEKRRLFGVSTDNTSSFSRSVSYAWPSKPTCGWYRKPE